MRPVMRELRTIGLWLEAPGSAFNPSEGIARVVCVILKELKKSGVQLVIALPKSAIPSFRNTCSDLDCEEILNARIVFVNDESFFVTLVTKAITRAKKLLFPLKTKVPSGMGIVSRRLGLAVCRKTALAALPVRTRVFLVSLRSDIRNRFRQCYQKLKTFSSVGANKIENAKEEAKWQTTLCELANREVDVDCWWVPNSVWHHAAGLDKAVITSVWDFVQLEYPEGFDVEGLEIRIKSLLEKSSATVSMSEYVREKHVVSGMSFPSFRSFSVNIPPSVFKGFHLKPTMSRQQACMEIEKYCAHRFSSSAAYHPYLVDFPFSSVDFIFAASNIRPYKNYLRLIQAFEYIVRRERRNLKLVVTGDLRSQPEVWNYLVQSGLTIDVVSLPRVPTSLLQCLFRGAKLTVMPSLFEGGFPLNFCESLAQETPIAMSAIPTVRELIPSGHFLDKTIFNPKSVSDMVKTILWCLDNSDEALKLQKTFFEDLKKNNWELAAKRYVDVFRFALENSKASSRVEKTILE